MKSIHTLAYSQSEAEGAERNFTWVSGFLHPPWCTAIQVKPSSIPACSTAQLYSSALHWARASTAEGCAQSWRTQSAWTRMAPEEGGLWGSHCWCVWLQCIRSGLKPRLGPGLTQAKPRPTQGPSLVNRARAVVDKGSAQEWRTGSDPTQNSTWRWWRPSTTSLSLVEMRQCLGRLEGLLWPGLSQSTLDPNQVPVSTSYSSISPFWGWGAGAADEGGGQYTLGWNKASSDPTLRLLLQ